MEIIRIPQVSLVDGTGRKIGVYDDDPDWWQQLKLKQRHKNLLQIVSYENFKTDNDTERNHLSPSESIEMSSSSVRLINNDNENIGRKKNSIIETEIDQANSPGEEFERRDQCNVIGETPLHIAIMYDDLNTIKHLIEKKGINVNQRSIDGKFCGGFNSSKTTAKYIQESKYEGLAYYGEYPLALAACFSNKEIYDYLIEKEADPNLRDSNGNTLLHVLVINDKLDMFLYASNHPKTKAHSNIKNAQELTPINLAAKLGRKEIFTKMLEVNVMTFWQYSNITCSAYPLEGIDTVGLNGSLEKNSALSFIVNGETDSHLDMLRIGVIDRLLEDKWSTYAERMFFKKLIISVIHLIFLSIAVYTRAEDSNKLLRNPENATTWVRYISEVCVVLICIYTIFLQIKEIYTQGFKEYILNQYGEPANVLLNLFCVFVILAVPFRFTTFDDSRSIEDTFIILAVPCGWMHLLLYARVLKVTGPFVVMIYKMIIGDILTFATIYLLLLFGFSMGFYYLYKNAGSDVTTMNDFVEAVMITFQMTLGEFKARLVEFDQIYYNDFTKIIFVVFMILMHILLLNMLIAMMGNTYHQIISKSEKEWRRQWAHIVILLERSFSPEELLKFQNQYCIKKPNKGKPDIVALMVIKRIASTKATKKQNSIRIWKKMYKSVKSELKTHKCTAVEMLEIWKNKEDLNKVKIKRVRKAFDWSKYVDKKRVPPIHNMQPIETPSLVLPSTPPTKATSAEPFILKFSSESSGSGSYDTKTTTINEKTTSSEGTNSGLEKFDETRLASPKRIYYPTTNSGLYPENSTFSLTGNTRYSKYSDFFDRRPIPNMKANTRVETPNYIKDNFLPRLPSHRKKTKKKNNDDDDDADTDDSYNIKSLSFHYQSN